MAEFAWNMVMSAWHIAELPWNMKRDKEYSSQFISSKASRTQIVCLVIPLISVTNVHAPQVLVAVSAEPESTVHAWGMWRFYVSP